MKRFIYFLLLIVCAFCQTSYAQHIIRKSDSHMPLWMKGDYPDMYNDSYLFKVVQGEGHSLVEARNDAITAVVAELARKQGVNVSGKEILQVKTKQTTNSYDEYVVSTSTYTIDTDSFLLDRLRRDIGYNGGKSQRDRIQQKTKIT